MSNQINDGGRAFPSGPYAGMSLRDYAIIKFMSSLMQREDFNWQTGKLEIKTAQHCDELGAYNLIDVSASPLVIATEHADKMIAEREKYYAKDLTQNP